VQYSEEYLYASVVATDVNKYSVTNKDGGPTSSTVIFFGAEQRIVEWLGRPITTQQQSVVWSFSQSRHVSAILLGTCWWLHLRAASGTPVVRTLMNFCHRVCELKQQWASSDELPLMLPPNAEASSWPIVHVHMSYSPSYLANACRLVNDARGRWLRSTVSQICVATRTYSTFGDRAFAAPRPGLWNSLPERRGLIIHCVSKKTSKIIFVITTSNFHQIWQFLAQRWQTVWNYMRCTHFPPQLTHVNALPC